MELLTPEKMRSAKVRVEEEQRQRIRKLNIEESEAVKRLNATLAMEEEVRGRVALRVAEAEEIATQAHGKAQNALGEVIALEERKRSALEPIIQREKDVQAYKEAVDDLDKYASKRVTEANEKNQMADDRLLAIKTLEESLAARNKVLDEREHDISLCEETIKAVLNEATTKATVMNKKADTFMSTALNKLAEVEMASKANDVIREQLAKDRVKIEQDKRAILDGYESLKRAQQEILK